jgi:hypothetical protein
VPRARLRLAMPESNLATYTFNKHVIKHYFCPGCGCAPFGFGTDPSGTATAAVNVRSSREWNSQAFEFRWTGAAFDQSSGSTSRSGFKRRIGFVAKHARSIQTAIA